MEMLTSVSQFCCETHVQSGWQALRYAHTHASAVLPQQGLLAVLWQGCIEI